MSGKRNPRSVCCADDGFFAGDRILPRLLFHAAYDGPHAGADDPTDLQYGGNARKKNPLRQENECVMIIKTPFYNIFIFHVHFFFPVRGKDET